MNRLPRVLMLCPCLALSAWSQISPTLPLQPLPELQQFLGLTDTQVTAIFQNNSDYEKFTFQQQQQIQQAQFQIAVETAKAQLDPMAIGTLYAQIETTCRSLRDKAAAAQQQNIAVLTDAQKAKLNVLNDAVKLAPTIAEAQSENLLGPAGSPPFSFSTGSLFGVTFGGFLTGSVSGCASSSFGVFSGIVPAAATGSSQSSVSAIANPSGQRFTRKFLEPSSAPQP
jgi:hypothetical protein